MSKIIVMTGSPKSAGFKTKKSFLNAISDYGYVEGKFRKTNNEVDILITDDLSSTTSKMKTAKELNVEIMTYLDFVDLFDLEGDLN